MRKAATKRGGSQIRAKVSKTTKATGTKKTIKAAPRRTTAAGLNSIKFSAKLMKNLTEAANKAGFKKVEKFVIPHLEKLANA